MAKRESIKIKLTEARAKAATCPAGESQSFIWDTEALGLGVRSTARSNRYIFQGRFNNETVRITIGNVLTWTIEAARIEARRLRALIDQGRDPRVVRQEAVAAEQAKREKMRKDLTKTRDYTLEKLLSAYCDHLKSLGRVAHNDSRSIFRNHVFSRWPEISSSPASDVTPEQIADMMRAARDIGLGRTANKMRSYIRAAYQVAKDSRFDARVPVHFKEFGITFNPAAETVPDGSMNKSAKNALTHEQMVQYWQIIKDVPGHIGAALRLHLLTGGQRVAQLVRLRSEDVQSDTITLYDNKGRPGAGARPHTLPLVTEAKKAVDQLNSGGQFVISTDGGRTHVAATTIAKWSQNLVGDQIPDFTIKRIRSGVETILAKHKVSKDTRGRLQSHGITGVQDTHYDDHDYVPEKLEALELLYRILANEVATVTHIRASAS